ncbi:hypothetical protein HDV00_001201 [Rhizophlyctis rosea]|nr:hypothetical protein HDV00_001201 [Rhizophlyctis rosea]
MDYFATLSAELAQCILIKHVGEDLVQDVRTADYKQLLMVNRLFRNIIRTLRLRMLRAQGQYYKGYIEGIISGLEQSCRHRRKLSQYGLPASIFHNPLIPAYKLLPYLDSTSQTLIILALAPTLTFTTLPYHTYLVTRDAVVSSKLVWVSPSEDSKTYHKVVILKDPSIEYYNHSKSCMYAVAMRDDNILMIERSQPSHYWRLKYGCINCD